MDALQDIEQYLDESQMDKLEDKVKRILEFILLQEEEIKDLRTALLRNASDTYILQQEMKGMRKI